MASAAMLDCTMLTLPVVLASQPFCCVADVSGPRTDRHQCGGGGAERASLSHGGSFRPHQHGAQHGAVEGQSAAEGRHVPCIRAAVSEERGGGGVGQEGEECGRKQSASERCHACLLAWGGVKDCMRNRRSSLQQDALLCVFTQQ